MPDIAQFLNVLANLCVVVFVVSSMLAMGFGLTVNQILEPLRDLRLVGKALLANFVLVPLVAVVIPLVIPLNEPTTIGLFCLATAAGAPFLPTLARVAKGSAPLSVGLMVLLMVVTVVYLPVVLPLLLPGVQVNPFAIAQSLVVLMLIPLGIGLAARSRYEEAAAHLQPTAAQISNISLVALIALTLVLDLPTLFAAIGTGAILAALVLLIISFVVGYVLGGPPPNTRSVLGLGTAQRNVSAALVVVTSNFPDPAVLAMVMIGSLLMLVLLMWTAAELGKRTSATSAVPVRRAA